MENSAAIETPTKLGILIKVPFVFYLVSADGLPRIEMNNIFVALQACDVSRFWYVCSNHNRSLPLSPSAWVHRASSAASATWGMQGMAGPSGVNLELDKIKYKINDEYKRTNTVQGFKLLNLTTSYVHWISHYDYEYILKRNTLTQK